MTPGPRSAYERLVGIPTGSLVALSLVPLAVSLAVLADPGLVVPVVALDLALALVAGFDLLFTRGRLEVRRDVDAVQAVGREFLVRLTLRNLGRRPLPVLVGDDAPGKAEGMPASVTVERSTELSYRVTVDRRGRHDFGDVAVRVRSPLGLWQTQHRFVGDNYVPRVS